MTISMENLIDEKWRKGAITSALCYNVSKKIREIYVNHSALFGLTNKASKFFENTYISAQRNSVGQDNEWTKNQLKRFYDVIGTNPYKEDLIATFNEAYMQERGTGEEETTGSLGPSEEAMLNGLNRMEEINYFLKAKKYEDPAFTKFILTKSTICLYHGDVECLKDIAGALHMDLDKKTIEGVSSKIDYGYLDSDLEIFNLFKTEESIRKKKVLFDKVSNGCGALLGMYVTTAIALLVPASWLQNLGTKRLEDVKNITENPIGKNIAESITNSSAFDSMNQGIHSLINTAPSFIHNINPHSLEVAAAAVVALWTGLSATRFFRKFAEVKDENKVGALSVEQCSEEKFKFFTRSRLVDGIIKKKEFDTTNEANAKHIALTGFLVEKLYDPAKKVSEFKTSSGDTLKEYLSLSDMEEQRLNQLTPDEIDTISQVKNLQARDVMSKNEFSIEQLLTIKKLDQVQQITGYTMKEEDKYFAELTRSDFVKSKNKIEKYLETSSPLESLIVKATLQSFSNKEDGKIAIKDSRLDELAKFVGTPELNKAISDMSQRWLSEKAKDKKLVELLEVQEKKSAIANNQETKEKLTEVFRDYGFTSLDGILTTYSREDGFGLAIKNKALNVMNSIRSKFASSDTSTTRPTA